MTQGRTPIPECSLSRAKRERVGFERGRARAARRAPEPLRQGSFLSVREHVTTPIRVSCRGYARAGALAAYEWEPGLTRFTAQINANNLFDKGYFASAGYGSRAGVIPGSPRSFFGSARMDFDAEAFACLTANEESRMPTLLRSNARLAVLGILLAAAACGSNPAERTEDNAPASAQPLAISKTLTLNPKDGRNPTAGIDQRSGAVYLAWAQEVPGRAAKNGKKADPVRQVLVARSDDRGRSFNPPVAASPPDDRVGSAAVSPTQVSIGPQGEVYVLYSYIHESPPHGFPWGAASPRVVRSEDRGKSFSPPIEIGSEALEGKPTAGGMFSLFAAPDGDLYASWLDFREELAYFIAHHNCPRPPNRCPSSCAWLAHRTVDGPSARARWFRNPPAGVAEPGWHKGCRDRSTRPRVGYRAS